ncbi:cobalamin B12-binding domain-containing protein [Methyloterricola oryzae]|uniref:cobalamin B12-binding domain-containing protein n=1 Tax=Methyloterricola oryzae TaxID=1495050 RepID=UPI0005EB7B82|nr:cobalamin-dependent protein [Methyloterricola oryzae]
MSDRNIEAWHAIVKAYNEAIYDTDGERALQVVEDALAQGLTPEDVVFKVIIPALEAMMEQINHDPDANLAQHFMTAQIATKVTERMLAKFSQPPQTVGRVIIGTSQGDLHSLGKRIVVGCLKSLMVDVVDLGINVPPERFVDEAEAHGAQVIAISSMMVHTARSAQGCVRVRQLLKERGLEERVRIVVGGAPYRFDPQLFRQVGADAWAEDGITAGRVILELIREVKPS